MVSFGEDSGNSQYLSILDNLLMQRIFLKQLFSKQVSVTLIVTGLLIQRPSLHSPELKTISPQTGERFSLDYPGEDQSDRQEKRVGNLGRTT